MTVIDVVVMTGSFRSSPVTILSRGGRAACPLRVIVGVGDTSACVGLRGHAEWKTRGVERSA